MEVPFAQLCIMRLGHAILAISVTEYLEAPATGHRPPLDLNFLSCNCR